jgi:hypothetical protein
VFIEHVLCASPILNPVSNKAAFRFLSQEVLRVQDRFFLCSKWQVLGTHKGATTVSVMEPGIEEGF